MTHSGRTATSEQPGPIVFVLFGATGDLAKRMVLPAVFRLAQGVCCRRTGGSSATAAATSRTRISKVMSTTC